MNHWRVNGETNRGPLVLVLSQKETLKEQLVGPVTSSWSMPGPGQDGGAHEVADQQRNSKRKRRPRANSLPEDGRLTATQQRMFALASSGTKDGELNSLNDSESDLEACSPVKIFKMARTGKHGLDSFSITDSDPGNVSVRDRDSVRDKTTSKHNVKDKVKDTATTVGDSTLHNTKAIKIGCSPTHFPFPQKYMTCESCEQRYCLPCVDIKEEDYSVLTRLPSFHWYCPRCEGKAVKSVKTEHEIETRCSVFLSKMAGRIEHLEEEMKTKVSTNQVETLVRTEVSKATETLKASVNCAEQRVNDDDIAHIIKEQVCNRLAEMEDRESRKTNLIMFNMPDNNREEETEETRQRDVRQVETLLQQHLKVKRTPDETLRLGPNGGDRPRPLKVVMRSEADKRLVLRNAHKLKLAPEPYKLIRISNDMSQAEREEHNSQLSEARRRDAEEQSGDYIHLVRGPPGRKRIMRVKRREQ